MTEIQHGQTSGWVAGCREHCCRAAIYAYNQKWKSDVAIHGNDGRRRVDATGSQRRIQALKLMGWKLDEIAAVCGWVTPAAVSVVLRRDLVLRTTAERIEQAHEVLWGRWLRGELRGQTETGLRRRSIEAAQRQGWVPSAAWNDIDNPRERPKGLAS
jgi:hypothetical protein